MEYLDVLTENGELTGQAVPRSEVHTRGLWHQVAHIWILNSKGELLIQKRTKNKESSPGLWDISAAGHLSAGQTVTQAALREIYEELGLTVAENDLIKIGVIKNSSVLNNGTYFNNQFENIFLIKRDVDIEKIVLQESEVDEVKFIPWQELRQMVTNNEASLVRHDSEFKLLFDYLGK